MPALFLQRSVGVLLAFVAVLVISGVASADQVVLPRYKCRLIVVMPFMHTLSAGDWQPSTIA